MKDARTADTFTAIAGGTELLGTEGRRDSAGRFRGINGGTSVTRQRCANRFTGDWTHIVRGCRMV